MSESLVYQNRTPTHYLAISSPNTIRKLSLLIPFLIAAACIHGCGRSGAFHIASLTVDRQNWDTLRTTIDFRSEALFGNGVTVEPESVFAHVFSTDFDTLYTGSPGVIPVPDMQLGNEERILIEICGVLRKRSACEQRSIAASPKRVDALIDVNYPRLQGEIDRGTYTLDYTLQRKSFDGEGWEAYRPPSRIETYFDAYVANDVSESVRVPIVRRRSRFNIGRYPNYRDFRYNVNSALMDSDSAEVVFDLYARLGREPVHIASERVVVRRKSQAERRAEVGFLTKLAARQILDRMKRFYGLRKAYVFINDWSYMALDRIYRVETELHWQDAFRGDWSDLTGELLIRADGSLGSFRYIRGSESAAKRWNNRMDSTFVQLDPVIHDPYRPPDQEDVQSSRSSR